MFAVVAGVVFSINRTTRYTLSTAAITLMILFCFNQVGDGFMLRYNSKLPIVLYVPKGVEVRYRIWSASKQIKQATAE